MLAPQARTAGGYRQYTASDLERLRFVRLAQRVGFTLNEAAQLLEMQQSGAGARAELEAVLRGRLARIDEQLAQLADIKLALEASLSSSIDSCDCTKCADLELLQTEILTSSQQSA